MYPIMAMWKEAVDSIVRLKLSEHWIKSKIESYCEIPKNFFAHIKPEDRTNRIVFITNVTFKRKK